MSSWFHSKKDVEHPNAIYSAPQAHHLEPNKKAGGWTSKALHLSDDWGGKLNDYADKWGLEAFWPTSGDMPREMEKAARILKSFTSERSFPLFRTGGGGMPGGTSSSRGPRRATPSVIPIPQGAPLRNASPPWQCSRKSPNQTPTTGTASRSTCASRPRSSRRPRASRSTRACGAGVRQSVLVAGRESCLLACPMDRGRRPPPSFRRRWPLV